MWLRIVDKRVLLFLQEDSSDDEDDSAELLAELNRIRKERAAEQSVKVSDQAHKIVVRAFPTCHAVLFKEKGR